MKKEYKALRDQIRVAVPNPVMRRSVLLKVGKALRAVREEDAQRGFSATLRMFGDEEIGRAGKVADAIRRMK